MMAIHTKKKLKVGEIYYAHCTDLTQLGKGSACAQKASRPHIIPQLILQDHRGFPHFLSCETISCLSAYMD